MDSCTKDGALIVPGGGFRFRDPSLDSTEAHLSVSAQLSLSLTGLAEAGWVVYVHVCVCVECVEGGVLTYKRKNEKCFSGRTVGSLWLRDSTNCGVF